MHRRASRTRRWLVVSLAALVVVTGVPWSEIHAHEDHPATYLDDSLMSHAEDRHDELPPGGGQHVHENGLFVQCPGVSAPVAGIPVCGRGNAAFADLTIPDPRSHTSPLLRPPARP